MVFSVGVCDIAVADFMKMLENEILKKRNFAEFQNEISALRNIVDQFGEDNFVRFQERFFSDIDSKLYLDGGILLSLWLHFLAVDQTCGGDMLKYLNDKSE